MGEKTVWLYVYKDNDCNDINGRVWCLWTEDFRKQESLAWDDDWKKRHYAAEDCHAFTLDLTSGEAERRGDVVLYRGEPWGDHLTEDEFSQVVECEFDEFKESVEDKFSDNDEPCEVHWVFGHNHGINLADGPSSRLSNEPLTAAEVAVGVIDAALAGDAEASKTLVNCIRDQWVEDWCADPEDWPYANEGGE